MQANKALLLSNMLSSTESIENAEIANFEASCVTPLDITVDIDPVQDLHGYDNPWPAGGGKNLYNADALNTLSNNGITVTVNNGTITMNGTATTNAFFSVANTGYAQGDYVFSFNNPVVNANVHCSFRTTGGTYFSDTSANAINKTQTLTGEPNSILLYVASGTTLTNFVFKPQLELGSTATSYAPYSNICPISGWDEVKVTRTGANVWDEEWEVGQYSTTTGEKAPSSVHIRCVNPIPVKPSKAYFFSTAGYNINVCFMDANMNFISNFNSVHDVERTTPSNCYFVVFNMAQAYGTTYNNNISINLPSSIHDYSSYQGQTVTIQLGQTVYGGTLNVTNGELVVDKEMVTFDGSSDESWIADSLKRAYTQINAIKKERNYSQSMKCDKLRLVSNNVTVSNTDYSISGYYDANGNYPNQNWVYLKLTDAYNTVASIREWLTANPVTIVYTLATPITLTLSPVEINSLIGENNVWSDTGNVSVRNITCNADFLELLLKTKLIGEC